MRSCGQKIRNKPWPNDGNLSTQHIATLLVAACGTRLATLLQHVRCCWPKFENGQIFHATFMDFARCCSLLTRFVQQCCARVCATHRNMVAKRAQHVAANNVAICCVQLLRSVGRNFQMLGQQCCDPGCDLLAEALDSSASQS